MAEMGFRLLDHGLVVAVHTGEPPDEAVWTSYVEAFAQMTSATLRVVVFSDGGRPSREQFTRLDAAIRNRDIKTLVVSTHAAVRIVGAMLNAMLRLNVSFSAPESVVDALDGFGITDPAVAQRVLAEAHTIAHELAPDGRLESVGPRHGRLRAG